MSEIFEFTSGNSPLLISIPHDGREIPDGIRARMSVAGRAIPDTDWHVARLYDFARELDASVLVARYSRYVVDLNRSRDDGVLYPGQLATGLCPERTFDGERIYADGGVDAKEKTRRLRDYWQPYHDKLRTTLEGLRARHAYALLWDAHSIPSRVPRLFDGELPALNLGSNDGASCAGRIADAVYEVAAADSFSHVFNGRFKGGFITRHYGAPENDVHALQLEVAQRAYMDETSLDYDEQKAARLRDTLRAMLGTFLDSAR